MPWYKIKFFSGPGHQSEHVYYEFSDLKLDSDEKHNIFDEYAFSYDNPVGSVSLVSKLPVDVKRSETKKYRNRLHNAQRMLDVIAKTPVLKEN